MAFVKNDPAQVASLATNIQKLTQANKAKNLRSFVVVMGGPETKGTIEKIAAEKKITIPVTFLPGGPKSPDVAQFRINPQVNNTVMLYRRKTIRHTFVDVTDKTFPEVEKAAAQMLAG